MFRSIHCRSLPGVLRSSNPLSSGLIGVLVLCLWIWSVNAAPSGTVVAWGNDSYGQTTVPAGLYGVTAIAAGGSHTVALVGTGPPIAVQSTGSNLTLRWPVTPEAYRVESTLSLLPPITWSIENASFQTNGEAISIVLPMTGGQKVYRLTQP